MSKSFDDFFSGPNKNLKVIKINADSLDEAIEKAKDEIKKQIEGRTGHSVSGEIDISIPDPISKKGGIRSPFTPMPNADTRKCNCGCGHDHTGKILKTVPATKAEIAKNKDIIERKKALFAEVKKLEAENDKWWAEIRLRIPDGFKHDNLSYNPETGLIEYRQENE